jgi:integrase
MRARLKLSNVENAKPQASPYEMRDSDIAGLLLRIQPSGVKTFYVELSRGVRIKLGRYPVLTVEGARTQAKAKIGEFAKTGERPAPKTKVATFGDFLTDRYEPWMLAERKTGARTIATIRAQYADLLKKPLAEVSAWAIEKHKVARLKEGLNPATVNRDLVRIKAALSKAVEWRMLPDNPLRSVKRAKGEDNSRIRFLSAAEEKALRKTLEAREKTARTRRASAEEWRAERGREAFPAFGGYVDHLEPLILVALNTGMRRGELTSITWQDVDLQAKRVTVRAGYAKSGKARHIQLNSEAIDVLKRWKGKHAKGKEPKGRVFAIASPKTAWAGLMAAAKISEFRFHDLRHTFASKLMMAGVDLNTVRELLGHGDIKMTLRYAHLAPEHKAAAVELLVK